MCRLRNIAMHDYQESVTTGQTHGQTGSQTDAGQSDRYVLLCFAGDTKRRNVVLPEGETSLFRKYIICGIKEHQPNNKKKSHRMCVLFLLSKICNIHNSKSLVDLQILDTRPFLNMAIDSINPLVLSA